MEKTKINPNLLFGGLALFGGYLLVSKVGSWFEKSPEQKEAEKKEGSFLTRQWWDPNFLAKLPKGTTFKAFKDKDYPVLAAKNIYNSKHVFNDDEARLWMVIRNFSYKSQIPLVSGAFTKAYGQSLPDFIRSFSNAKEVADIFDYLDKLPSGLPSNIKID